MRGLGDIVLLQEFTCFIYGYVAFDVPARCLLKVLGCLHPNYTLQPDSDAPSLRLVFLGGFSLSDVQVEVKICLHYLSNISLRSPSVLFSMFQMKENRWLYCAVFISLLLCSAP